MRVALQQPDIPGEINRPLIIDHLDAWVFAVIGAIDLNRFLVFVVVILLGQLQYANISRVASPRSPLVCLEQ